MTEIIIGTNGSDWLFGGDGDDLIYGLGADDGLIGGAGADYLDGGPGFDSVDYSVSDDPVTINLATGEGLGGDAEGDTLVSIEQVFGSYLDDILIGDNAANELDGLGGDDIMKGGGGADTLTEDSTGFGNDTLKGGGGADILSGGYDDDELFGESGNDTINGGTGADALSGGTGNDVLTGGGGADNFVFDAGLNANTNVDEITDFQVNLDEIWLDGSIFAAIGATLGAGEFHVGNNAADANDFIIYNDDNGNLFYDGNGNGAGGKVRFAELDAGLALDNGNFLMV